MPVSMTPNEDAARAMQPGDNLLAEMNVPGDRGVAARITSEMLRAMAVSLGREFDVGSEPTAIVEGIAIACGNVVASVALSFSDDPEGRNDVTVCVLAIIANIAESLAANNDPPKTEMPIIQVSRA